MRTGYAGRPSASRTRTQVAFRRNILHLLTLYFSRLRDFNGLRAQTRLQTSTQLLYWIHGRRQ